MHDSLFGEPLDDEGRTALRSELEEAQSQWTQANVGAYRVEVEHWTMGMTTDYRLEVEGDSITSAVRIAEDGEPSVLIPGDSLDAVLISWLPTVSYLFQTLDSAVDSAFSMVVEYDPALGYPRTLAIDPSANALDDEVRYSVQELEVTEGR